MKAELRKEYQEIAEQVYVEWVNSDMGAAKACKKVALACQELADRPQKELTNAEIHKVASLHGYVAADGSMLHKMLKAIEAAHIAKQREPQVVKLRVATSKTTGEVYAFKATNTLHSDWEWLDADGQAQEFEVKV